MNADEVLRRHGVCRIDRELFMNDAALVERLQDLPKEYRAEMVQAAIDDLVCLPPDEAEDDPSPPAPK